MTHRTPTPSHEVDRHIGQRIRVQRLSQGMTQKQLGDAIALSYQQIQRYESGADHCRRLNEIAIVLQVSPGIFFPSVSGGALTNVNGVVDADELTKLVNRKDTIRLLRAFHGVRGPRREFIIETVEGFAWSMVVRHDQGHG